MSTLTLDASPVIPSTIVEEYELKNLETLLRLIDLRNAVLNCVSEWLLAWKLAREICYSFETSPIPTQQKLAILFKSVIQKTADQGEQILVLALKSPCSIEHDHFKLATSCNPDDVSACVAFLRDRLDQFFSSYDDSKCAELRDLGINEPRS